MQYSIWMRVPLRVKPNEIYFRVQRTSIERKDRRSCGESHCTARNEPSCSFPTGPPFLLAAEQSSPLTYTLNAESPN